MSLKNSLIIFCFITSALIASTSLKAASDFEIDDDDLNVGGDIFNDFYEDIESAQIAEDERYYRYGRFFSFHLGLGLTNFGGNRGAAYEDSPPTYAMSVHYFKDFQSSFGLGFFVL